MLVPRADSLRQTLRLLTLAGHIIPKGKAPESSSLFLLQILEEERDTKMFIPFFSHLQFPKDVGKLLAMLYILPQKQRLKTYVLLISDIIDTVNGIFNNALPEQPSELLNNRENNIAMKNRREKCFFSL